MAESDKPQLAMGAARRGSVIALRWQRSQKLAGYYDPDRHALIYQDRDGREVDRVDLPLDRRMPLTSEVQ